MEKCQSVRQRRTPKNLKNPHLHIPRSSKHIARGDWPRGPAGIPSLEAGVPVFILRPG